MLFYTKQTLAYYELECNTHMISFQMVNQIISKKYGAWA